MTSFEKTAAMLNNMIPELEKGLTKGQRVFRQTKRLAQGLTDVTKRFKFFSEEFSKAKRAQKALEDLSKEFKKAKEVQDKLLEKIPGGGSPAQKALNASKYLGGLMQVFLTVAGMTIALKNAERNQKAQEQADDRLGSDISRTLSTIQTVKSRLDTTNEKVEGLRLQDQRNRDRIYAVENQLPFIRGKANDALYEVRQGRQILENKIKENEKQINVARQLGNDALYEVRAGRTILEERLAGLQSFAKNLLTNANSNFQKLIDSTYKDVAKQIAENKKAADKINADTSKTNADIAEINRKIAATNQTISGIKLPENKPVDIEKIKADITSRITEEMKAFVRAITPGGLINFDIEKSRVDNLYDLDKQRKLQDARWEGIINDLQPKNSYLDNFVKKLNQEFEQFKERAKLDADAANGVAGAQEKLNQRFQQDIADFNKAWRDNFQGIQTFTKSLEKIQTDRYIENQKQIENINNKLNDNERKQGALIQQSTNQEITKQLEPIKADLTNIKGDLSQKIKEIQKLDTQIKERIQVDDRVEKKIDSIIPTIAGIPFIVGRIPGQTTNLITPKIPTVPSIKNGVKETVCNLDCQLPSIQGANNAANGIKNDLGQKIRDGNSALQSGVLAEILRRLGDFIPGGISGKLVNGFKWLQLDRALNILTFAATVHNAAMLSNDIIQTLIGALTNVLTLIVPKDDAGKSFDIGQAINSTVENVVKGIVGAENYTNLSNTWAKANRIYQATTNVLNSFMSLTQTVLQAAEMIAAYTGKIGNALRKGGVVLENAYGWMNPQPKFNRVTQSLENLQQAASTVQMVTQVPLDVISQTTELTNASTEFVKAVKEDTPANKATPIPEPDELKAKESQAKTDSQPPPFDFSDLFDGEDL